MKTRTLYPAVEVFDDPEFCNNFNESPWKIDFCGHCIIDGSYPECGVFIGDDGKIETLLEVGTRITKCQQCKDLFKKSLSKEDNE